jgi:phage regulator Rha-like protein
MEKRQIMSDETKAISIRLDRTLFLRGQRVVLDEDLAAVFGVPTKRLNEQIRRNLKRFPEDFLFQPSNQGVSNLRSQFATSKEGRGGRRYRPYAFTEHGAVMAANVLNSPVAIQASVVVVRAFIKLREAFIDQADLKRRLADIERRVAKGFSEHEQELREIRFLISELQKPEPRKKSRLGF